eukprot:Sspe_Gene.25641::Locus_10351_Transcript_1_1_Confidence_1.000_Length_6821::g.25641::m.25641
MYPPRVDVGSCDTARSPHHHLIISTNLDHTPARRCEKARRGAPPPHPHSKGLPQWGDCCLPRGVANLEGHTAREGLGWGEQPRGANGGYCDCIAVVPRDVEQPGGIILGVEGPLCDQCTGGIGDRGRAVAAECVDSKSVGPGIVQSKFIDRPLEGPTVSSAQEDEGGRTAWKDDGWARGHALPVSVEGGGIWGYCDGKVHPAHWDQGGGGVCRRAHGERALSSRCLELHFAYPSYHQTHRPSRSEENLVGSRIKSALETANPERRGEGGSTLLDVGAPRRALYVRGVGGERRPGGRSKSNPPACPVNLPNPYTVGTGVRVIENSIAVFLEAVPSPEPCRVQSRHTPPHQDDKSSYGVHGTAHHPIPQSHPQYALRSNEVQRLL